MRYRKLELTIIFLLVLGLSGLQAQVSINTTGGNASGSGGSVNYSIGQIVFSTFTGADGSVAGGVQQPYEISVITGIEEAIGINLSVLAYPNPTSDYLTLEVKDFELSSLRFHIYDMNGKLLQNRKITGNRTSIVMNNLKPGTYFIKVISNKTEVKVFKIIKY